MRKKLSDPHTALRWAYRLGLAGIAVILLDCTVSHSLSPALFWILMAAGVLLLAGAAAVELFFCRCPHCGNHVGWFRRRPFSLRLPEHCPRCGHQL